MSSDGSWTFRGALAIRSLAINGPETLLREHGWATIDAMSVSRSLWDYQGFHPGLERGVRLAKHARISSVRVVQRPNRVLLGCRTSRCGQDTGWSAHVPAGTGLLPFSSAEEAMDALDPSIATIHDTRRAVEIATEVSFEASRVLPSFLERACE